MEPAYLGIQSKIVGRSASERLEQARDAAGITQDDVARELGVTQQLVSSWEKGTKVPDRHRRRLAEVLGVDLADLQCWIAADEEQKHNRLKRTHTETVKVMERFVDQYQDLGHSYQAMGGQIDELVETMAMLARDLAKVAEDIAEVRQDVQRLLRQPRR